jgi:hypothetical protein
MASHAPHPIDNYIVFSEDIAFLERQSKCAAEACFQQVLVSDWQTMQRPSLFVRLHLIGLLGSVGGHSRTRDTLALAFWFKRSICFRWAARALCADNFFVRISPAHRYLCLRFKRYLAISPARLDARMDSLLSFPVGLFHPLQHAGLSRRSPSRRPLVQN